MATGFKRLVREATVEAGSTTTVKLLCRSVWPLKIVTVEGASPQIHYESHEVDGMVTRPQIEGLPVNGRNFLELAKLEPGAQQPTRTSNNRTLVPLLGAPVGQNGRATRVTVDGGSVMEVGNGGSAMGFSQDAVQEFQVSTVNFDLSTGATASGAVNVATRSGSNELHGSGFYFFRTTISPPIQDCIATCSIPILSSSAGSSAWQSEAQSVRPCFFLWYV